MTKPLFFLSLCYPLLIITDLSGIRHYDVQVRENGGNWDDWLTAVDYTGATFVGTLDTTYTFRIKATDNVLSN